MARRVLELSTGAAGAYCGRFMRLGNLEVTKVEAIEGSPIRNLGVKGTAADEKGMSAISCLFEYADAGKRSVAVDFGTAAGRDVIRQLAARAEVVIWEKDIEDALPLDLLVEAVRPPTVIVALSHYGLTGPHADARGSSYTDWAAGGYTYITGYPDRPPRAGGGPWPAYAAAAIAGFTAIAGLRSPAQETRNSPLVFDVSIQDVMVSLHQWTMSLYTHQGVTKERAGNRHAESYHPMGFLPCQDGWVCVGVATAEQWERFCLAIDMPELLLDPRFDSGARRYDNAEVFDAAVRPWFGSHTAEETVRHLQQNDVPASRVLHIRDVLDDEQLRARNYWREFRTLDRVGVVPATPVHLKGNKQDGVMAPALGQHTGEVLRELGYSAAEIERLTRAGALTSL